MQKARRGQDKPPSERGVRGPEWDVHVWKPLSPNTRTTALPNTRTADCPKSIGLQCRKRQSKMPP